MGSEMKQLIFVIACLVMAYPAKAAWTGNDLYNACSNSSRDWQLICGFWISGFQSGVWYSQEIARARKREPATCIPVGVTGDQAKLVIEKYMRDHPERLQKDAGLVASYALDEAFPCKQ